MSYDIDHNASLATIGRARSEAVGYAARLKAVLSALSGLSGVLPHSPKTADAVLGYANGPITTSSDEVIGRTNRALVGGEAAVIAYQEGDSEMRVNATSAALAAPMPEDMPGGR